MDDRWFSRSPGEDPNGDRLLGSLAASTAGLARFQLRPTTHQRVMWRSTAGGWQARRPCLVPVAAQRRQTFLRRKGADDKQRTPTLPHDRLGD